MRYLSFSIENHPVLGNLSLDFKDPHGNPFDTIIIAGENGVGKTVVLNELYHIKLARDPNKHYKIKADILLSQDEINAIKTEAMNIHDRKFEGGILNGILHVEMDYDNHDEFYLGNISFRNNKGDTITGSGTSIGQIFKSLFSSVEINFNPQPTRGVTASSIDLPNIKSEKSSDNLATTIKQLLVDIDSADASDLQGWVLANTGKSVPEDLIRPRIKRFSNAFSSIFPSKQLKSVVNANGNKDVLFEENGRTMSIDVLSSGEKQIVFRGGFFLRNKNSVKGHLALIDEPEISMHPIWEMKILDFFKSLFIDPITKQQESQLIIATHSEYVLKSALADESRNLVIVLKKDANGQVSSTKVTAPIKLQTITSAEINYLAFGIYSTDYHIQLYSALQYREGKDTIKDCDDFIKMTPQYLADVAHYRKPSSYTNPKTRHIYNYETLSTYIRNAIDHPDSGNTYTDEELRLSTELLRELL